MRFWAKSVAGEPLVQLSLNSLDELLKEYPRRDFHVRLWNGSCWGEQQHPRFTLILRHPEAVRAMFWQPSELSLGEAYVADDFDVEGDLEAAFDLGDYLLRQERGIWKNLALAEWFRRWPATRPSSAGPAELSGTLHSKKRDQQAVRYHYDLPTEFYAKWLDTNLVYSCAYFHTGNEDLDQAQQDKLEYICKKLRLRRGDRLLDIGCGWGALVLHAARHYGAHAVGITLSRHQAEMARQRISQAGLTDRCRVEVWDYRDLEASCQYDKIVSVGMFEHVGESRLGEYFRRAWSLLRPGGVFLNHGIAYSATYHRRGASFIDHYVFPDGEIVPIHVSLREAELNGFEVRDVESLREHYALTLRHWLRRLEAHRDELRQLTNDTTYRIWRLYIAGSAHGFRSGRMNLYQSLLAKPDRGTSGLPLTRQDWYGSSD
jgi:cyclopropane-fatty-acyl-phospholipid synthase